MADTKWDAIKKLASESLNRKVRLTTAYIDRLQFELREIEKQGAEAKFIKYYDDKKRFQSDGNRLLILWLLGLVDTDPLANRSDPVLNTVRSAKVLEYKAAHGHVPSDIIKDPDMPDIDVDCLPEARDPIKEYAISQYGSGIDDGYGSVCSVGTWTTYKFKSAIIDVCVATALVDKQEAQALTTALPQEVDDLKEGGKSTCKGIITDAKTGEQKECGTSHNTIKCPVCGAIDTDGPTIGKLLQEHDALRDFAAKYPKIIGLAVRLIGCIRNMGMHAGALIIADRPLFGNIPLAKSSKKGYWISMWTEGRNTQLSKLGWQKWDLLGLKTLKYIYNCCRLIEQNRGISFGKAYKVHKKDGTELIVKPGKCVDTDQGEILVEDLKAGIAGIESIEQIPSMDGWDDIDPTQNRAGHFFDYGGQKHYINLNDTGVLELANEQKVDGVFQFDSDLAKSILANGVRNFRDLMLLNAMGHPGPMQSIPEAIANRDDKSGRWQQRLKNIDPVFLDVLGPTYGTICYQEQLQAIWQRVAGFTAPEAQEARKAVAKKWAEKLKPIERKWINGASRTIGEEAAREYWQKMVTFGRYAFNQSHAVSYCLVAHRCLWLKAHFAPEWWTAVMSDCHPDKLVRYMGVARAEGWQPTAITYAGKTIPQQTFKGVRFDTINVENLTASFTVTDDTVNQGLVGIKGIGDSTAQEWEGSGTFISLDDFIAKRGKKKIVLEAFIKLGAFRRFSGYENAKATWQYYRYKYCTGKDITAFRSEVRTKLLQQEGWNDETIEKERQRQLLEYRKLYPRRLKMPDKILKWQPKPDDSCDRVMALFAGDDYTLQEILSFEKHYLGYYLHSPLDLYDIQGNCTISQAKEAAKSGGELKLEAVITDLQFETSKKNNKPYARVFVSDGIQTALVLIFSSELGIQDENNLVPGTGVQMIVDYDEKRGTFTLARGEIVIKLLARGWNKR